MKFACALVILAAATSPVLAQSLPPPADWQGLHVGANAGIGRGTLSGTGTEMGTSGPLVGLPFIGSFQLFPATDAPHTIDGTTGGITAGYDWQLGGLVIGIEGNLQLGQIGVTSRYLGSDEGPQFDSHAKLAGYATLGGRIGVTAGPLLLYGTAGFAAGRGTAELTVTPGVPPSALEPFTASASNTHLGYAVGAGLELALGSGWSVLGEYQFIDLGPATYDFLFDTDDGSYVTTTSELEVHAVRFGLNYRF